MTMGIVVVGEPFRKAGKRHKYVKAVCYCGKQLELRVDTVRGRLSCNAQHCGSHGMAGTPTYISWQAMLNRCQNPNHKNFVRYGQRGIKVCDKWQQFSEFHADMGDRPDGHTLDRIDGAKGYEPGNCRWADGRTQQRNRKDLKVVEYHGSRILLVDAIKNAKAAEITVYQRIQKGWEPEKAIDTPACTRRKKKVLDESGIGDVRT
jgi:hypothetical protein